MPTLPAISSLDKAIGVLLQKLEETGHDKDTVIMLAPDHYPYGLDIESLNALAGREPGSVLPLPKLLPHLERRYGGPRRH